MQSKPFSSEDSSACEAADIKPSILLVEDEPTTQLILSRQLTRAGYEVEVVSNGVQALATLQQRFFPLLLTDWDMPEMNGVALCQAVREMPLEGYVYTILLTARVGKENVIAGLAAGADDYLIKPPDDNELRARLNTGRRILRLEWSLREANRRIHLLSVTDALTAAFNRRYLMEQLPREIERARRNGHPLSVVLCDVDHFKKINDAHGHQAGDKVLQGVAELLRPSPRANPAWVSRYGGEEFLIVLPETSVAEATIDAERMRIAIKSHPFDVDRRTFRVSASFGVAGYDRVQGQDDNRVNSLIAEADRCLYRSKAMGRNRVTAKVVL